MADKNLARSGPADIGVLSDDDPLAELARIVGYEPRNVPTAARPVPPEPLQEPVFDLEGELLREFVRYDAPSLDPAADVQPQPPTNAQPQPTYAEAQPPAHAEPQPPAYAEPLPSVGAGVAREGFALDIAVDAAAAAYASSLTESPAQAVAQDPDPRPAAWPVAPVMTELLPPEAFAVEPSSPAPSPVVADAAGRGEPVFPDVQPMAYSEAADHSANDLSDFDLDRELELSLGDAFTAQLETPRTDACIDAYEAEPQVPVQFSSYDAAAAGLVIADTGTAHSGVLQPSLVETLPVLETAPLDHAGIAAPPVYAEPVPVTPELGEGAHFEATQLPAEIETVAFVPDWLHAPQTEAPLAAAEQALPPAVALGAATAAFDAEATYAIAPAARAADGYELDELLAEVERYPVPEARAPMTPPAETPRPRPGSLEGFSSIKFGRATPVALDRRPANTPAPAAVTAPAAVAHVEPQASTVIALPAQPVSEAAAPAPAQTKPVADSASAEFEAAFGDFEFDLSEIELVSSDLLPADEPKVVAEPVAVQPPAGPSVAAVAPVIDARDARPQPAWPVVGPAEPVPAMSVAQPAFGMPAPQSASPVPEREEVDIDLPFDPAMIAETDTSVAPAAELDVPQIPVVEKERPVQSPEYDIDIDSEMAQLFANPVTVSGTGRGADSGLDRSTAAAAKEAAPGEADEFDRALEEDLRRSFSQSERHAIPLDAQQTQDDYVGDGYDEPARRGRGLMVAAAAAVVVVLGGAGTYAFLSSSGAAGGSGEPKVILADREPVKIVPEEKGGKTVPNQDKAVYDRVAGTADRAPQQDQLVTSTEEPVDVVQRTLTPESLPFDGPEDETQAMETANAVNNDDRLLPGVDDDAEALAASEEGRGPLVSPRKVRTMIVKPDGTLVAREEPAAAPESALAMPQDDAALSAAAGQLAPAAAGADTGLRAEQADNSERALQEAANASVAENAPVGAVGTTAVGNQVAAAAPAEGPVGEVVAGAPVPVMRPADQPVDVVGTVTERGRVTDTRPTETAALAGEATQQPAEQAQAPAANPGGYVIQIASLPSEAEAQKSYASLSAKFSGVIGGRGVDIQRADIPNKGTYYRVRIPAGSREEANALCGRYKGAGGTCLVTR